MREKILLLAPSFMNIYKDVISGLENLNMDVVWVQDEQIEGNPYNRRDINRKTKSIDEYDRCVDKLWDDKFIEFEHYGEFDYFLAIDGLMVSNHFFQELRQRYPNIKNFLYLFDRVEDNYELSHFFINYDKIFTFERSDAEKYGINHLPIYWTPISQQEEVYDIFGMGTYKAGARYESFCVIKNLAEAAGLRVNISLYHRHVNHPFLYQIAHYYRRLKGKDSLGFSQLKNNIFTEEIVSPDEFRLTISKSRVILDTHNSYQDGLTARFMWAIGQGKKIITTNKNVIDYPFYDSEQVMVLNNNYDEVLDFIRKPYKMKNEIRNLIQQYRIDNWLKTVIDLG